MCSEVMSVHAKLVKTTLVFCMCCEVMSVHAKLDKTPVVCERRVYHTRSSRGASKRRTFVTVHTKGEHEHDIICEGSSYNATIVITQNKMHKRINITCNS